MVAYGDQAVPNDKQSDFLETINVRTEGSKLTGDACPAQAKLYADNLVFRSQKPVSCRSKFDLSSSSITRMFSRTDAR